MNEVARRSKAGGIACFIALPAALTIYFIAIYVGAANGAEWALNNDTYVHMNSWFHGRCWWLSSEGVWLYGGWWNVLNGIAGLFNIFCMTGW